VLDVPLVERYGFGQVQFFFVCYFQSAVDVFGQVAVGDTIKLAKISFRTGKMPGLASPKQCTPRRTIWFWAGSIL
ncbi:MAG: hypothetical protein B6D64_14470, partial [Bacteroidetes bacterium 4484_276]